ncbi:Rrf2 family transcriptional regulator [Fulvivirga sp. M361]|uniref:RrF2 family transcriptional regulator n=1 Tax=Fulvivirga sp. M361 TaxID=2594266 RepID=UPI001179A80C|nr:Rrf2 family transcriptional regulator [Fulvivirga sp. M361]TRX59411.1 Rrf2 family transcriptional regulator [Fulvivirga sp. M361]
MFSKSCEYALQAILYICLNAQKNRPVGLKDIAEAQKIPLHFLSKVLQELVKHKVLDSAKGPKGGFSLVDDPNNMYLLKIVEIVDGSDLFDRCGIGLKECSDEYPCPIHFDYQLVKEKIKNLLSEKTIYQLCIDVKNGDAIVSFSE